MRLLISIAILLLGFMAHAQTVEKVSSETATIAIQGSEVLNNGDKVSFLNDQLDVSGQGEVVKVSDGGKKALVKVTSGTARPGMSLEKISETVTHPRVHSTSTETMGDYPHDKTRSGRYLDDEDRRILRIGEISTGAYVIGGVLGTYPLGLGIGHAVQGRYLDKGWIFTAGELGSLAVAVAGLGDCVGDSLSNHGTCSGAGLLALGMMSYIGFRVWEIIDVWIAPIEINRRYRDLQLEMKPRAEFHPIIGPTKDGLMAGLQVTF